MAGFDWTTTGLIASIKRRGSIPTSQSLFTEADMLSLADEELQTVIFPIIMSIKGDYFVNNNDTVMTSAKIYPIPSDAIGLKIKDCYWLDSDGDERQITEVNIGDVTNQVARGWIGLGYYLEKNNVVLTPNSREGDTLRIKYYRRASKMVPTSEAAQISSIDTGTGVVTFTGNIPSTWTTSDVFDAIDDNPGFETKDTDLVITATTATTMTFSDVTNLAAGYWISLADESPIPQITPEAHALLAQSVTVKILEALGDPKMVVAQGKFEQIKKSFIDMVAPRADGQVKKIVQRNGTLAWPKLSRWGWR